MPRQNHIPINIGNYNAASGLWDLNGQIDYVGIWNRASSADEIAQRHHDIEDAYFMGILSREDIIKKP